MLDMLSSAKQTIYFGSIKSNFGESKCHENR